MYCDSQFCPLHSSCFVVTLTSRTFDSFIHSEDYVLKPETEIAQVLAQTNTEILHRIKFKTPKRIRNNLFINMKVFPFFTAASDITAKNLYFRRALKLVTCSCYHVARFLLISYAFPKATFNVNSSNINQVIRAVFFTKRFCTHQKHKNATKQTHKTLQANKNKKCA